MSGMAVDSRLRHALVASGRAVGAAITITRSTATNWASATFSGARHEIELAALADDPVERWLEELPETELSLAGHLVADLKIVAVRQVETALTVTIEVLTVEEQ